MNTETGKRRPGRPRKTPYTTPALSRLLNRIQKGMYTKKSIEQAILRCAKGTREKWEGWLLESDCQFADFYKPRAGLNFYQVYCLCMIADWKSECKSMPDSELKCRLEQNIDKFQLENVMAFSAQHHKASQAKNANVSEIAIVKAA